MKTVRIRISAIALALTMVAVMSPSLYAQEREGREQPHMRAALEALQKARQQLQVAEHNKGGHRDKALKLTDEAIQQVRQGINYAEAHEKHPAPRKK